MVLQLYSPGTPSAMDELPQAPTLTPPNVRAHLNTSRPRRAAVGRRWATRAAPAAAAPAPAVAAEPLDYSAQRRAAVLAVGGSTFEPELSEGWLETFCRSLDAKEGSATEGRLDARGGSKSVFREVDATLRVTNGWSGSVNGCFCTLFDGATEACFGTGALYAAVLVAGNIIRVSKVLISPTGLSPANLNAWSGDGRGGTYSPPDRVALSRISLVSGALDEPCRDARAHRRDLEASVATALAGLSGATALPPRLPTLEPGNVDALSLRGGRQ